MILYLTHHVLTIIESSRLIWLGLWPRWFASAYVVLESRHGSRRGYKYLKGPRLSALLLHNFILFENETARKKQVPSGQRKAIHSFPDSMATMPSPAELMEQEKHVSDTMVPDIIAVNVACFTIACVGVILRFVARRMARVRYEADDWLIVVALVRGISLLHPDIGLHVEAYSLIVLTYSFLCLESSYALC